MSLWFQKWISRLSARCTAPAWSSAFMDPWKFVELDIPGASKHRISVGIDRKELITVRAGGIEIDIPKSRYNEHENQQRTNYSCNQWHNEAGSVQRSRIHVLQRTEKTSETSLVGYKWFLDFTKSSWERAVAMAGHRRRRKGDKNRWGNNASERNRFLLCIWTGCIWEYWLISVSLQIIVIFWYICIGYTDTYNYYYADTSLRCLEKKNEKTSWFNREVLIWKRRKFIFWKKFQSENLIISKSLEVS